MSPETLELLAKVQRLKKKCSTQPTKMQGLHRSMREIPNQPPENFIEISETPTDATPEPEPMPEPEPEPSDSTMFGLDEYGGRSCAVCGTSIDGHRAHAEYCSDACRARSWRIEAKGPAL